MSSRNNVPFPAVLQRGFVVLLATGLCLNGFMLWSQGRKLANGYSDFIIFYSAARIVSSGYAAHLYDSQTQYQAQLAIAPQVNIRQGALPYNHPPFEALLFVPLSHLPYFAAYLVWAGANLGMLFLAIWLLRRRSPGLQRYHAALLLMIAVACFPIFMALFQGQDLLLLLLIASTTYALLEDKRDFYAGCVLGLGTFRPELSLPVALLVALNRGKRFPAGFILSTIAMIAVSGWAVGWHSLVLYPRYVWHMERLQGHGSIVPAAMPNLRGLISLFLQNERTALLLTILASIAVLSYAARTLTKDHSTGRMFPVVILFALLVSYHALIYDLTLLLLPLAFIYEEFVRSPDGFFSTSSRWTLLGSAAFFFCAPLLVWLWLRLGLFSLVAVVLLVWLMSACREITHPASLTSSLAEEI